MDHDGRRIRIYVLCYVYTRLTKLHVLTWMGTTGQTPGLLYR